ncbi:uncharacterized protein LOC119740706 [Patiria miniata]|uniref:Secreted protein n=1 Tax=Patiria miniata TaxID=46514 RepID=A0A914B7R0_PATMI|nr:uncharacterized protein LOC119740706 [Patiria miniata]
MLRFVCLFLAAGILSAEALQQADTIRFDVKELAELPCPNTPWVDSAYFLLSDTGYNNPTCNYYMEMDLRSKVEEYCKRSPGACSFRLANVLGKEPDPRCVSSFEVGYLCI